MAQNCLSYNLPSQQEYYNQIKSLVWDQIPAMLDKGYNVFPHIPTYGAYNHFRPAIKSFMQGLYANRSREYTISGAGSLIDYHKYGHELKAPTPQLIGTGCNGNSLCLEPTCYGFTEGVRENNNVMRNICWELKMPCLKDWYYSERNFTEKVREYISMFYKQPFVVAEALQRTNLLKNAIKVVATNQSFNYTGTGLGTDGIPLPFYVNPTDNTAFPDITTLPGGVGGFNMEAFFEFLAPRLFSDSFRGDTSSLRIYGLKQDFKAAMYQTASVQDKLYDQNIMQALAIMGKGSMASLESMYMKNFEHDGLFPTFALDNNVFDLVPADILQASTLYGYEYTQNPIHCLQKYRGVLIVPDNWGYSLIEPPMDDFSMLGLGEGLNFRQNTPGTFPLMSSSMFSRYTKSGKQVIIGVGENLYNSKPQGVTPRATRIREAIRTEVRQTYSSVECNNAEEGQLPNVGPLATNQAYADGFAVKSTMWWGSDVRGISKPVLVLFETDQPRGARPIIVCNANDIEVTSSEGYSLVNCCPGEQIYAILTFTNSDMSTFFTAQDTAVFRNGAKGYTYEVTITAVSGNVVTIESADQETLITCCPGGSGDQYGNRGELINTTGITETVGNILKAECDIGTRILSVEFNRPVADSLLGAPATITLCNGTEIAVTTTANASGVFAQFQLPALAGDEECDPCEDCSCWLRASVAFIIP